MALGSGRRAPKAQASGALGEEQVQELGSATTAPPLCRPQVWTIPPDHPEQQNGGQTTNRDVPALQTSHQR